MWYLGLFLRHIPQEELSNGRGAMLGLANNKLFRDGVVIVRLLLSLPMGRVQMQRKFSSDRKCDNPRFFHVSSGLVVSTMTKMDSIMSGTVLLQYLFQLIVEVTRNEHESVLLQMKWLLTKLCNRKGFAGRENNAQQHQEVVAEVVCCAIPPRRMHETRNGP